MRVAIGRRGARLDMMAADAGEAILDAAAEATIQATNVGKAVLRRRVAAALGAKVANVVTGNVGPDRRAGRSARTLVGAVGSRWWRRSTAPGGPRFVNILDSYADGGTTITAHHGKYLAVPTADVIKKNNAPIPPASFAEAGIKLRFVPAGVFGKYAALVVDGFMRTGKGRAKIASRTATKRRKTATIVMYWLVKAARVPGRFRVDEIREEVDRYFLDNIHDQLEKRGV